ncbi:amino acid ABC transporter ATP-binding protein [Pseudochelatococcus sp. B33]
MSGSVLEAKGVCVRFGALEVLHDVNLSIGKGETVAIIGPSGSGKTTFLRCLNFLVPYCAGEVLLKGELVGYRRQGDRLERVSEREVCRQRARIGFVFQRFNLFPHRTVLENLIEGPVFVLGVPRAKAEERARTALERVGLSGKSDLYPDQLSGGQQQRVAIARALCMEPEILLLDEVTSALDPELVGEVLTVLRRLADEGTTMVLVTHELSFAERSADRVVFMEDGRVEADVWTKEFFKAPPTRRIASFIAESRSHMGS